MPRRAAIASPRSIAARVAGKQAQMRGFQFEAAITWEAARAGVLAVRGGLVVKYVGPRPIPQKSGLDFALVCEGRVAFVDAKAFAGRRFGRSALTPHQVVMANAIEAHGAMAGFIVMLREINAVVFYRASLFASDARAGFGIDDGTLLGRSTAFDLRLLFTQPPRS